MDLVETWRKASSIIWKVAIISFNQNSLPNTELQITDFMGHLLHQEQINSSHTPIDFSKMANGLYIVNILQNRKAVEPQKLVLTR